MEAVSFQGSFSGLLPVSINYHLEFGKLPTISTALKQDENIPKSIFTHFMSLREKNTLPNKLIFRSLSLILGVFQVLPHQWGGIRSGSFRCQADNLAFWVFLGFWSCWFLLCWPETKRLSDIYEQRWVYLGLGRELQSKVSKPALVK